MNALNVVVIGTGMYASGRGTDGYGTILPAILEWKRDHNVGDIYLAGTDPNGAKSARDKTLRLSRIMGMDASVSCFPNGTKKDKVAYLKAIGEAQHPACAIIAVPDNLHFEIAGAAIGQGLHTLVVKPLAPTLKEVDKLIQLQKKKGVYCAVEFHKRFDLANLKLRDTIQKGAIGDPLYFLVEYSQRKSIPLKRFRKWIRATNIFQYLGVHYLDIIYFATKAKPLRAMALGQKGWLRKKGVDAYDSIEGVIEWQLPNGRKFLSHILTNWIDPEASSAMSDQAIKVIGTKGRFESNQKRRGILIVTDENGIEEPNPYFSCGYGKGGDVSYRGYGIESIGQFLDDTMHIEAGLIKGHELEGKRPTFREAVVSTAALEAVNASLMGNGKWVGIQKFYE